MVVGVSTEGVSAGVSLKVGSARVGRLVAEGVKRSSAARLVAEETGLARRELFSVEDG